MVTECTPRIGNWRIEEHGGNWRGLGLRERGRENGRERERERERACEKREREGVIKRGRESLGDRGGGRK